MKVKRNAPCPCGSRHKYKFCCYGTVDWNAILNKAPETLPFHLTARGKNQAFLKVAFDALNLPTHNPSWQDVKHGCSLSAIERIHAAVSYLWPSGEDLHRVLSQPRDGASGLYIGHYAPSVIRRGVTRHSIYTDRILLIDPFPDHRTRKPEWNPLQRPEIFQSSTLRWLGIWADFAPWIDEGLVEFVRSPGDFDLQLQLRLWTNQSQKLQQDARYRKVIEDDAAEERELQDELTKHLFLSLSDRMLTNLHQELHPRATDHEAQEFLDEVRAMRAADSFFPTVDAGSSSPSSSLLEMSTGLIYEMARITANTCNAHLITDIPSRWWEIEQDRKANGASNGPWEPLAKAFGNAQLQFLDAVPLQQALILRKEGRLASMRVFLRKVMSNAGGPSSFDSSLQRELADQLQHEMSIAEREWKAIDRDLLKWLGGAAAGALASSPIVTGAGALFAAAAAMSTQLIHARGQRHKFLNRHPAAFFVGLAAKDNRT